MKITDLLSKESVLLNIDVKDKDACLVKLVDLMAASGKISDKKLYLDAVYAREEEGTTGVGNGMPSLMEDVQVLKNQVLLL